MVARRPGGQELGRLQFTVDQLPDVRGAVRRMLSGLDSELTDDVLLAVHEVAANSVVHGAGVGVLRAWDDGPQLTFEVDNPRDRNSMPMMQAPTPDQPSGRGLRLAGHLIDRLSVDVTTDHAMVRLHLERPRPINATGTAPP